MAGLAVEAAHGGGGFIGTVAGVVGGPGGGGLVEVGGGALRGGAESAVGAALNGTVVSVVGAGGGGLHGLLVSVGRCLGVLAIGGVASRIGGGGSCPSKRTCVNV